MENLDINTFLTNNRIDFKSKGNNVGHNFVNINCPFCLETRYHCGVHKTEFWFKCFVCGVSGSIFTLQKQLQLPYTKLNNYIYYDDTKNYRDVVQQKDALTRKINGTFDKKVINILTKKPIINKEKKTANRFVEKQILKAYNIAMGINKFQDYVVFEEDNNFIGYLYDKSKQGEYRSRYKKIVNNAPFLMGFNLCKKINSKVLIICEGIFDLFRIPLGYGIAVLGSNLSNEVVNKISKLRCRTVVIAFDKSFKLLKILESVMLLKSMGFTVKYINWNKIKSNHIKDIDDIYVHYGQKALDEIINIYFQEHPLL